MQYILSQEEKDNLVPKIDKTDRDKALELARLRILQLANRECAYYNHNYKCDGCPCLNTPEERKDYEHKTGPGYDLFALHNLICSLPKRFSK